MAAISDLGFYKDALIVLTTAGVVVPVVHRLKISPVIGYLAAGALLGPKALGSFAALFPPIGLVTIGSDKVIGPIAELGVVFLLFVIGLELSPERILTMRRLVFGLGGLQVLLTSCVIGLLAPLFGNPLAASVVIGLSLALSSTAVGLEWLSQSRKLTTSMGRAGMAVLLFQDIAVVPILFLVGILEPKGQGSVTLGLVMAFGSAVLALGLIVAFGRLLLRPLFRQVGETDSPELFMAATLLVAIGTGVVTAAAGLSMALGGFVAGLLLAETEYRKAIEATIAPFKGLLLGVFFISVGMKIDPAAIAAAPLVVLASVVGLIVLKAAILTPLARAFGLSWPQAAELGLLLGPGGEFAFIVIALAASSGLIGEGAVAQIVAVVALSMAATPIVGFLGERIVRHFQPLAPLSPLLAEAPPGGADVRAIVVGAGRVGRLVSQMLTTHKVPHLLTDRGPRVVVLGRQDGLPVYYGDAKSPLFLKSCGIDTAQAVIITINNAHEVDEIVEQAHRLRPKIVIVARAKDAVHARHLYARGVTDAVPETIEASLQLSEAALVALGAPAGPVIASIHEKRDEFRHELQAATKGGSRPIRGLRASIKRKGERPA